MKIIQFLPLFDPNPSENWSLSNHYYASSNRKKVIETLLILNLKNPFTKEPKYQQSLFYLLPKNIILDIFQHLPLSD